MALSTKGATFNHKAMSLDALLDSTMGRMLLLVAGASAFTGGLGLLFQFVLDKAIPNPDTRHTLHTVLLTAAYGGLLYVGFWVQ